MPAPSARRTVKTKRRDSTVIATEAPSASGVTGSTVSGNLEIQHEDIARLAYALWEARGSQDGSPEQDWLQAEQELRLGS